MVGVTGRQRSWDAKFENECRSFRTSFPGRQVGAAGDAGGLDLVQSSQGCVQRAEAWQCEVEAEMWTREREGKKVLVARSVECRAGLGRISGGPCVMV